MSRSRGPSRWRNRMKTADQLGILFVLLVGLSGGLIALQSNASVAVIGTTILGSLVVGSVLLWSLLGIATE
ncbi:hypothetical protein [Natrinema halophilum]|uniref:Uncharacterized protein n=1 Tax=Natrinema halophilum TaxID=1699371 RepID=A0A7D5GHB8_9EURY|nr:hypothetical protein [Natrinema halophilum]QLG48994.1 hypothetical protein HYG82_09095 [Natrinema halophilum]